ncbi:MAG: DUF1559 domain-containing protein [Planctomycetota bacterium]
MPKRKRALTLVEGLVVLVVLLLVMALLLPAVRSARPAAYRNACQNNLKQIALALHNYYDENGHFPPAYTVDEAGNRLHSWRALILPYIEESALFERIDFTKPWDDPANEAARSVVIEAFECPSIDIEPGMTTYLAAVGPNWAFAGEVPRTVEDIEDGTANTICLIEVSASRAVHWMSPYDADETGGFPFDKDSQAAHPGVYLAAYLDGHCSAIARETEPDSLAALLTVAAGDEVPESR